MLLHVTIHLKRKRDRIKFVHRDVLIYNIIRQEQQPREQPEDLLAFCVEKSKALNSFECNCQAHRLLLATESLPMATLLGELQQVNLPINDQNGVYLMQALLTFIGTKIPNSRIMSCTKHSTLPVSCKVVRNGKAYSFNAIPDYIVKDYIEKTPKTLAVGEVQSSPVSQMMVAAVGIMANESPNILLGITMTKKLACHLYLVSTTHGYDYKTDLTGPIQFEHLNSSIYQLNDPKGLQEFCKIVAHFFTMQKIEEESESEESSSEDSQAKRPKKDV